jgi:hypothetical protein
MHLVHSFSRGEECRCSTRRDWPHVLPASTTYRVEAVSEHSETLLWRLVRNSLLGGRRPRTSGEGGQRRAALAHLPVEWACSRGPGTERYEQKPTPKVMGCRNPKPRLNTSYRNHTAVPAAGPRLVSAPFLPSTSPTALHVSRIVKHAVWGTQHPPNTCKERDRVGLLRRRSHRRPILSSRGVWDTRLLASPAYMLIS